MHELAITESIVEQVVDATNGARVTAVHIQIGQLSGVVAASVEFCFELVTNGTALAGARLDIEQPGGRAYCSDCQETFDLPDPLLLCPCGSADVRIIDGDQLLLKSVEVA